MHIRSDAIFAHVNKLRACTTHLMASFSARCNPIPELFIKLFISSSRIMQLSILIVRGGLLRIKNAKIALPPAPHSFHLFFKILL